MFRNKKALKRRRRRGGFGVVRLFLSLCMLGVLAIGVYSAAKAFSGIDPLKISPKSALHQVTASEGAMGFLDKLLTFSPKTLTQNISSSQDSHPSVSEATPEKTQAPKQVDPLPSPKSTLDFSFAVVADSENDNKNLLKALTQAKKEGASFIIGVGDYTDVGTIDDLRNVKIQFDSVSLPYYLIPGDHDEWDSRNKGLDPTFNFKVAFGMDYQSFTYHNVEFLLIDNADNYEGVSDTQENFINKTIEDVSINKPKLALAFTHEPFYHPSSDHAMGRVTPSLENQAAAITRKLKAAGFSEVIAGATHYYSRYKDPLSGLNMTVAGAVTEERNLEDPRFIMVDVYTDGSYNVSDIEVKQ